MKTPRQNPPSQADRKDRLKAALKANIAKRKSQAKTRQPGVNPAPQDPAPEQTGAGQTGAGQTEAEDT